MYENSLDYPAHIFVCSGTDIAIDSLIVECIQG